MSRSSASPVKPLKTLAQEYVEFMGMVGNTESEDSIHELLSSYFSSKVIKIENGKLLLTGHEGLMAQLHEARSALFPWKMKILDVMSSEDDNAATVRFIWSAAKGVSGTQTTMAILRFDEGRKIQEINEVWSAYSGTETLPDISEDPSKMLSLGETNLDNDSGLI